MSQILIVDHNPIIRDCCCRYLHARGYDAAVAADGLQCIEQLQALSPDLLVLDPEILWGGGSGVLAWLQEEQPLKPLKVLLTDGHCAGEFSDDSSALVVDRLERPAGLAEVSMFIDQIQQYLCRTDGLAGEPPNDILPADERRYCRDEAQAALRGASYAELQQVTCCLFGDSLVLSGSVPSFFLKQLAQTLVMKFCSPTIAIENRLKVAANTAFSTNSVRDELRPG